MTSSKPDQGTVSDPQLVQLALDHGWDASKTSLFDEEGVEGWRWVAPDGIEYTVMGDWAALTIGEDERLRSAIVASLQRRIESKGNVMSKKRFERFVRFQESHPAFATALVENYYESMPAKSPPQLERGFLASTVQEAASLISLAAPQSILCGTQSKTDEFRSSFSGLADKIEHFGFFEGDCFLIYDCVPLSDLR